MRVTIRDAAMLLGTTEAKIYDWVESGDLPAYKINDQYRISRSELLEWATARKLAVSPELFHEAEDEDRIPTVSAGLRRGGVIRGIGGNTREEVLAEIVKKLPLTDEGERVMLLDMLLARESLGTTGVGDGIAIPHVRRAFARMRDIPGLQPEVE